jgi:hypothetical protein
MLLLKFANYFSEVIFIYILTFYHHTAMAIKFSCGLANMRATVRMFTSYNVSIIIITFKIMKFKSDSYLLFFLRYLSVM